MPKRKKQLDWSDTAKAELAEGMAYYAERNPAAARRMLAEINKVALSLIAETIPTSGKAGRMEGTRELVLGRRTPYTIIFREVSGDRESIEVLHVLHQARQWPSDE
jgi:plasmid stabilization system protein ParE